MSDSLDVQAPLPAILADLQEALESLGLGHLQVQARLSGHRLLLRLEGDPLPEPNALLESLSPALEQMALTHRQRQVELFGFLANEGIPFWPMKGSQNGTASGATSPSPTPTALCIALSGGMG